MTFMDPGHQHAKATLTSLKFEELDESIQQALLAAVVECSDDAIVSKTLDGEICSWNPAAVRLFGYQAHEVFGKPITLIIPPELHQEEQQILDRLKRGERVEHFDTVRLTKSGLVVPVSLTVSPIRNLNGRIIGASKIARDLRARKRAEQSVSASERALREAHEQLQVRTAELARFNHAAVERELRITELKKEVDELRAGRGVRPRYPLLSEEGSHSPSVHTGGEPREAPIPLEAILRNEQLRERPARPPDHALENQALTALVQALADSPRTILQALAEKVRDVLQVGSAGLSLLTEDGERFYWAAISGQWSPHLGDGTPRDFGPCGDVLDRNVPLLFTHWERRYPYLAEATPLAEEGLLVPFYVNGRAVGTIWAIAHDTQHRFDAEDLRLLQSLGNFASAAYQAIENLGALEQRLAAVSLMEDAVYAREAAEEANRRLREEIAERERVQTALAASERRLQSEAQALRDLNEWNSRLWHCRDLSEGLGQMLTAVIGLLRADMGHVLLFDESRRSLRFAAQQGFPEEFLGEFPEVSMGDESACGRALQSAGRVVIHDVELDSGYEPLRHIVRAADYRAVVCTPLIGANGKLLGILSTHFRVPHTPGEQELHRLDLYVRQASGFIERCSIEEALQRSQDALREADRRKDEFLALLAHELRNPLAPIRYALAAIRKEGCTPEQQGRAQEVIERQISHMSRLLDDLLDVSRITRGALTLKRGRVELTSVIGAAIEASRPILDAKRHALSIDLPKEAVRLDADTVRLAQVFSNLLINAAKYTDPGGHIQLETATEGTEVVITVRDDGIGIAPEMMPRLFTLFSQAASALDRSEGGLGIGLALAQGLAKLHGGSIEARSNGVHQGSEFIVRLPIAAPSPGTSEPIIGSAASVPGEALKVLVVDDNQDAADTCRMLLELSGQCVNIAYTGSQALELAEGFEPDVILLDIGLPDMSGYELARKIRAAGWGERVFLIAVTGWGQEEDRRRALEAGFDRHLTKPIEGVALEVLLTSLPSELK